MADVVDPDRKRKSDLVSVARRRAAQKGLPFALTVDDLEWPDRCPVLDIVLDYGPKGRRGGEPNSPSIDRVDPCLGYVPENAVVMSKLANTIKSSAEAWAVRRVADWLASREEPDNTWQKTESRLT